MGEKNPKRYYWLKLHKDFFNSLKMKRLRKIAGGETYTIIYLKLMLHSLDEDGYLYFDGVLGDICEELALILDEQVDDIRMTMNYLNKVGLITMSENGSECYLNEMKNCIGSETASAQRVRDYRERQKLLRLSQSPDALQCNAETLQCNAQMLHCNTDEIQEKFEPHFFNQNFNQKQDFLTVNGMNECSDKTLQCNTETLQCNTNSLQCNKNVTETLQCNTDSLQCNTHVTELKRTCSVEKEIDIDIDNIKEKNIKKKSKKAKAFLPPSLDEVKEYCEERHNSVNPEAFVAFYASKDWHIGKSKMKDWKQAVITWEIREREQGSKAEPVQFKPRNFINIPGSPSYDGNMSELESQLLDN